MKRLLKIVLSGGLLFGLFFLSAYGVGTPYFFEELGMSIELPEGHIALTRDMEPDDPVLEAFGYTKEEMDALLAEQDMYFTAWNEDVDYE